MDEDDIFEELCSFSPVQTNANLGKEIIHMVSHVGIEEITKEVKINSPFEPSSDVIETNGSLIQVNISHDLVNDATDLVDTDSKFIHFTKDDLSIETSRLENWYNSCMEDAENSDSNKENLVVPKQKACESDIEKDFTLVVAATQSECDDKLCVKLLGTRERLFVPLKQDDLNTLQKKYNQRESGKGEDGNRKRKQRKYNTSKSFGCRSCKFVGVNKCDLMVHIVENHKDVAEGKKLPPAQCIVKGKDLDSIYYRCFTCTFVTKFKSSFFGHLKTHKSLDEVETFRCNHCSFRTKSKHGLTRHLNHHQAVQTAQFHKCPHCEFRTIHEKYVDTHIRMLHEAETMKQFKCISCSFQTKYLKSYQQHLLIHKTQRKMYKCSLCPFQTHHLEVLKRSHQLTHTNDEAKIYSCAHCSYKTKRKGSLIKHVTMHKDPDKIKMWKCGICTFKTRHKYTIKYHQMTHEIPDKDRLWPCNLCSYKAKSKMHMRQHVRMMHSDKCKLYKCKDCSYQSKISYNVIRHSLTHRTPEELTYLKCHLCEYQAVTKEKISAHYRNVHMNPEDVKWFQCKICDFKTRQKGNLQRHMRTHQHPERDLMVAESRKCKDCDYSAKTKAELLEHALKFRHNYLKCDQCNYKTPYRSYLPKHKRLRHGWGGEEKHR